LVIFHGRADALFEVRHPSDLTVNLDLVLRTGVPRDGDVGAVRVGAALLVPRLLLGLERFEPLVRRWVNVNATGLPSQQVLTTIIAVAWELFDCFEIFTIATVPVAALATLPQALIVDFALIP